MANESIVHGSAVTACTLAAEAQQRRLAEFDALFRTGLRSVDRPGATRLVLTFARAPGRARAVRDLARREAQCCSFFSFSVSEDEWLHVDVVVPISRVGVLDLVQTRAVQVAGLGG